MTMPAQFFAAFWRYIGAEMLQVGYDVHFVDVTINLELTEAQEDYFVIKTGVGTEYMCNINTRSGRDPVH